MRLLHNPRKLATFFYRKRLPLFEVLNKNVLYNQIVKSTFAQAKSLEDRFGLYKHLNCDALQGAPIDYLEFGVWQGATIQKWCELNSSSDSRFYGFDTFDGLPENWNARHLKGCFGVGGIVPRVLDPRVRFIKGLFQNTLTGFLKEFRSDHRLVVHVDCDLYSSALCCLTLLHPYLVPGSIVVFDEFRELEDEFSAFIDYTRAFYRKWKGLAYTPLYSNVALLVEE